ncbi:AbiH family protein [Streptococcus dentiloxodontae]
MRNRLLLIGNGFDLAHGLPTRFDPDFKEIAERNEANPYFWDLYQSEDDDIWSDFENLLAKPDFNALSNIFDGYYPDYLSDRESDRDEIILQADMSGNLQESLNEFASQAEDALCNINPQRKFKRMFYKEDLFINFNYTHTLEQIYGIKAERVLHIHGEVGENNLLLGYPEGNFLPDNIQDDVRKKGRGPYREVALREYINSLEDYYVRTAYENLANKVESFKKEFQIGLVEKFLSNYEINEIIVYGHSCAIDFPYFEYLNHQFPYAQWTFYAFDDLTQRNIEDMILDIGISSYTINS